MGGGGGSSAAAKGLKRAVTAMRNIERKKVSSWDDPMVVPQKV
jgi:hypothetical protein